jgi:hypothetical protein
MLQLQLSVTEITSGNPVDSTNISQNSIPEGHDSNPYN